MKAILIPALLAIFQNYTRSAPVQRGPFARAVQDQNKIGWSHFLAGRISHLWALSQTKYLKTVKKFDVTTGSTGETWAKKLLSFLILRMHNLWLLRNDHRTLADGERDITTRRLHLEKEVRWIYSQQSKVDSSFQRAYRLTEPERLALPTSDLETYVATFKDFILHGLQTSAKQLKLSHRSIASFFLPVGTGRKGDDRPP